MENSHTYYAVYLRRGTRKKSTASFLLNVYATSPAEALRIARSHGHRLPTGSYATRIGRAGYFASLRQAFGPA